MANEPLQIDERLASLVHFMTDRIPFNRVLGMRVEHLTRGRCVLRIPWRDELIGDPMRPSVHGGVTSALADTAGGAACFSQLADPLDRVSTVDLRIDYLRPTHAVDLWCDARVVRMGNKVAVAHMSVFGGGLPDDGSAERAIASGTGVYNVLRRSER